MGQTQDNVPIYEGADLEALATLNRYQRWIVDTFQPYLSGTAIEFGAGLGNISTRLRSHVSTLELIEPSANLVDPLRKRFENDEGVSTYLEPLETRLPDLNDAHYDSVVLVNVLEHIEDDAAAVQGFYRILKPGGHLLLFVPALRFLYSDLDRLVGHYRRYHRPELNERVETAGFEIMQSRYFDTIGVLPWLILNRMLGATGFNPFLVNVYDTIFAPISRGLESLAPPPFGKNILLVARKPHD